MGPLLAAGISGISGLLGMLRPKQRQQQTSTTTPTLDPAYGPLQQMLISQATQRLQGNSLPANYEAGGVAAINRTHDLVSQGANNSLVSRGLAQSPVAGAVDARLANSRAGDIGNFRANMPVVQRELQNQDFGNIAQLLNFGRGSTTTGTNVNEVGGGAAGGATNLMQMLGYLIGSGAFGRSGGVGNPPMGAG